MNNLMPPYAHVDVFHQRIFLEENAESWDIHAFNLGYTHKTVNPQYIV